MRTMFRRYGLPVAFTVIAGIGIGVGTYLVQSHVRTPRTTDPFLLGQHYFNSDNATDGVYDLKRAAYYYGQAVTEDPGKYPLAWYQLARVMFVQGRLYESLQYLDKQEAYFQDQIPNIYYMRGLVYGFLAKRTGDAAHWEKAAENFTKFTEHVPGSIYGFIDLSWIYFAQGKYDEMLETVAPFRESDNPWIQNMYGLALLNTGKASEAHDAFAKAEELASGLTTHDWGKVYPGNDPRLWDPGLESFRSAVKANKEKAQAAVDTEVH